MWSANFTLNHGIWGVCLFGSEPGIILLQYIIHDNAKNRARECLSERLSHASTRAEASRGTMSAFLRGVLDNTIHRHTRCDLRTYTYTLLEPDNENENSKCPSIPLSPVSSGSRSQWSKEVCCVLHIERHDVIIDDE